MSIAYKDKLIMHTYEHVSPQSIAQTCVLELSEFKVVCLKLDAVRSESLKIMNKVLLTSDTTLYNFLLLC